MADRRQIAEDIKKEVGNFFNLTAAARYLGMSRGKTRTFLQGVPFYQDGKEKRFLAIDVAKRIEETRRG